MAYPTTPLTVVIEFWDGTQWVDVTSYVYNRGLTIRRGFPDEGTTPEPGSMRLTLNNRDGRFSPRNPTSPYYGLIGRNTKIRATVDESFVVSGDQIRFVGEISEWPPRWDVSGRDVWVEVTAQGVLRRLGQGVESKSALRRAFADLSDIVAYWPMEDAGGTFASALPGQAAISVSGSVDFASASDLLGSQPLPIFTDTTAIAGTVHASFVDRWFVDWLIKIEATPSTRTTLMEVLTSGGTAVRWVIESDSSTLYLTGYDGSGSTIYSDTGAAGDLLIGPTGWVGLQMFAVNASIFGLTIFDLSTTSLAGCQVSSGGIVAGTVTGFRIPASVELDGVPMGHIGVFNSVQPDGILIPNGPEPINGFAGETAADRADRLCDESGITFDLVGTAGDTALMGAQETNSFIDAFNETWAADLALAYETRADIGLSWRSRVSLYNQDVALTLDYDGTGEIGRDLEPTDDDQRVRNDVEVKRRNGSSARVVDSATRMGTQAPPSGVGVYDSSVELNLYTDDTLENYASWLVHIGTWDEARYPSVSVNMAALARASKTSLIGDVAALNVGDRIQITNAPAWLPPETIDLMVLGFEEPFEHPIGWIVKLVCVPYGPWLIAEVEHDTLAIIGSEDATTTEALDTTETGVDINCGAGADWVYEVNFDIVIGGERMTVTAVGAASGTFPNRAQTLTVTRSVNGVSKSHSTGASVAMAQYAYIGL